MAEPESGFPLFAHYRGAGLGMDGPLISTERLHLNLAHSSMADASSQFHVRNADHFRIGSPDNLLVQQPDGFWSDRLAQLVHIQACGAGLSFYGTDPITGDLLLEIHVSNIVRGVFQACHIGYKIDQGFEGKGLMFEAMTAVIGYLFDHVNLHRIMANYQPSNQRSSRLLQRLGFTEEGLAKDYLFLNGQWRDHVLTALTNPNWQNN